MSAPDGAPDAPRRTGPAQPIAPGDGAPGAAGHDAADPGGHGPGDAGERAADPGGHDAADAGGHGTADAGDRAAHAGGHGAPGAAGHDAADAGGDAASPGGASGPIRRRTHPLTPLVSAARTLVGVVLAMVVFASQALRDAGALLLVGAAAGLLVVLAAFHYLAWRRTEFYFDDSGDLRVDSGILQRKERRVALSRLQGVDIVRPLLGRVVGLAQLRVEVAGGSDSRVLLSFLSEGEARSLRAEIIARAAGVDPGAGEAPEAVLAAVPTGDLIVGLLLRSETALMLGLSVVVVVGIIATEGAGGLFLLLLTGGLPLLGVVAEFGRYFGFTVAESPDGLRLRHGLASVSSQTVPPGRVQAIEVAQPLLWRRRGWVRVSLNVAGLASGSDEQAAEQVLLPVAPREVAAGIIARVLPGVDLSALRLDPPPARARRRAWLQWSALAVAVDDRVLATRRGWLTTRLAVIPHARTQSVGVSQGPWQRRLGLATVRVDSTPGPVRILGLHRDAGQARVIAEEQLVRAARARAAAPAERWMTGPGLPPAS